MRPVAAHEELVCREPSVPAGSDTKPQWLEHRSVERPAGLDVADADSNVIEEPPAMRLNEKARNSDKVRGEELESALSVRNLALLGRLLAVAALERTESRGAHFRLDYPNTDDVRWRMVTRLQLGASGEIEFHTDSATSSARAAAAAARR